MDEKIVRTKEQILQLKAAIEKDLSNLPETDVFGESNDEGCEELCIFIRELSNAANNILPSNTLSEVYCWLTGKDDTLGNDYNIGTGETPVVDSPMNNPVSLTLNTEVTTVMLRDQGKEVIRTALNSGDVKVKDIAQRIGWSFQRTLSMMKTLSKKESKPLRKVHAGVYNWDQNSVEETE